MSDFSEIDENDTLWKLVMDITGGDRDKATKMIADPDGLTKYPQIEALLKDEMTDNWERTQTEEILKNHHLVKNENDESNLVTSTEHKLTILQRQTNELTGTTTTVIDDKEIFRIKTKKFTELKEKNEIEQYNIPTKRQLTIKPKPMTESQINLVEGDPREHINLVFIGHVDAGKSTLSGNILYLTENVDKRTIERYEREAKERNRESWFLAFIMDTNEEERAKGKTVEVGRAYFTTDHKRYTILDAPGHKNYVPNMIMGASQADIGVLVISARKGEFETGFDRGGQTREHAMLAKTLGVTYLIVVINKMDDPTVAWDKRRYDECVMKIRPFLKSCGFVIKKEVKFLPISGLSGSNVREEVSSVNCPWWRKYVESGENNTHESTLISLLDSLEIKGRNIIAPLRLPVLDRYTDRGTIAMGKVESGIIQQGMKITLMPTRNVCKIDGIWINEEQVNSARPGENVLVKLNNTGTEDVIKGFVICSNPPCRSVKKLIGHIGLMDMPDSCKIFTAGLQTMFHAHTCEEECTIMKLFETTNNKGHVIKKPRFASIGM